MAPAARAAGVAAVSVARAPAVVIHPEKVSDASGAVGVGVTPRPGRVAHERLALGLAVASTDRASAWNRSMLDPWRIVSRAWPVATCAEAGVANASAARNAATGARRPIRKRLPAADPRRKRILAADRWRERIPSARDKARGLSVAASDCHHPASDELPSSCSRSAGHGCSRRPGAGNFGSLARLDRWAMQRSLTPSQKQPSSGTF